MRVGKDGGSRIEVVVFVLAVGFCGNGWDSPGSLGVSFGGYQWLEVLASSHADLGSRQKNGMRKCSLGELPGVQNLKGVYVECKLKDIGRWRGAWIREATCKHPSAKLTPRKVPSRARAIFSLNGRTKLEVTTISKYLHQIPDVLFPWPRLVFGVGKLL